MFRLLVFLAMLGLLIHASDMVQPEVKPQESVAAHDKPVNSVACSAADRYYATASDDSTAILWDANTRKAKFTLKGHVGPVLGIAFSPKGKLVATGGTDKTVRIWDAETGKPIKTLKGHND